MRLTAAGRRSFRTMARAHEGWILKLFADLKPAEITTLLGLLAKAKRATARAIERGDAA